MRSTVARYAVLVFVAITSGIIVLASSSRDLLAGGSDSLDTLVLTPFWGRILGWAGLALVTWWIARPATSVRWGVRVFAIVLVLAAYSQSVHVLRYSARDNIIEEIWLLMSVGKLDVAYSRDERERYEPMLFGTLLRISNERGEAMRVFVGIPPLALETGPRRALAKELGQ